MSAQIVRQIEAQVRSGELRPGQRLPTEAQLAEQFGVSRGVVREALKSLETIDLITSRQGSGSYIRDDPRPAVWRTLALSVTPDERSIQELFEFRETIETQSAATAAAVANSDQIAELREIVDANARAAMADDRQLFAHTDTRLHTLICEVAGNRYASVVLGALHAMQVEVVAPLTGSASIRRRAVAEHRAIVEAIATGDAAAAAEAVGGHVRSTAAQVRRDRKSRRS